MFAFTLFIIAIIFTLGELFLKKRRNYVETFLSYLLFFMMGVMGILAAYAHIFRGPETAQWIGWAPGSPFQFEMGMTNLSYGFLGILAYWFRGRFWEAAGIGWSVLLLGCFVGHVLDYINTGNNAPYNIGPAIWFYDLFLPLLVLSLLWASKSKKGA